MNTLAMILGYGVMAVGGVYVVFWLCLIELQWFLDRRMEKRLEHSDRVIKHLDASERAEREIGTREH